LKPSAYNGLDCAELYLIVNSNYYAIGLIGKER
jgi:hypothetical protein